MSEAAHANALIVGEAGLLLRGASGSGKSALTLEIVKRAERSGAFARLVGDDRVFLESCNGRVIATAHKATLGAIELRSFGLASLPFEPEAVIRCVVDLETTLPPRLPDEEDETALLCGLRLPRRRFALADAAVVEKIFVFLQYVKTM